MGQDADVARWVADRIPHMGPAGSFGACAAIGVVSEAGEPLAGVVFNNWLPDWGNIEASFASVSSRWLTKSLIRGIMHYPFGQLGCQRVTALTPRLARPARRFLDTFGFKREGLIRKGFGSDDMVVSGLLKDEWLNSRWMRQRGQEHTTGTDPG